MRLWLLILLLRLFAKPRLARTTTPAAARAQLRKAVWLFLPPPFLLHLPGRGGLRLDQISVGAVRDDAVILYFHGGAYLAGSPATHAAMLGRLSRLTGVRVIAPDYRLAPEYPAPAAFEDAQAAFRAVMDQGYAADQIVLGGDSAGGGLALALLADICKRGTVPAGAFAFSPWTDLAMTGESLRANAKADPLLPVGRIAEAVAHVCGALAVEDPRISPLYADFPGCPAVFLQVGTTEILRDDSRRMADVLRAGGGAGDAFGMGRCSACLADV